MLKNYFITAFRNFRRNKVHTAINLLSLCIGLSCCILIFTYVQHELSYDDFYENADQIYRLEFTSGLPGEQETRYANINKNADPGSLKSIPAVKNKTRFAPLSNIFVETNNKKITESDFWVADSSFFTLFDFTFIEGNRMSALAQPNSLVLTQKTARKYFGNQKVLGKKITASFQKEDIPLTVSGVIKLPSNTHLQFDAVASKDLYHAIYYFHLSQAYTAYNYLQLKKGADVTQVERQIAQLNKKSGYIAPNYHLRPLTDIHLHSAVRGKISPNSNIRYIWFLAAIAVILLIIAGINFTSLATAQTLQRHKEAGMRKVLGAGKVQLIAQFLIEAILVALVSILAGYFIIYYSLPFFNTLAGSQFVFADFLDPSSILLFTLAGITIGILAGIYPAVLLSAFQPVKTLKGIRPSGKKGASVWKSIVVVQFAASIAMIICTASIFKQLQYIQNKNLGFDKDRIITITNLFGKQYAPMKTRLNSIPGIQNVTISSYVPGISKTSGTALVQVPGRPDSLTFNWVSVDYNYLNTYDIKLKEGRMFSKERASDSTSAFLLNEAAVQALGWNDPIGKEINTFDKTGRVIGVTQDFNFLSLYQEVPPLIFLIEKDNYFTLSVKVASSASIPNVIAQIEDIWKKLLPNTPFTYSFVDQRFDALYKGDQQVGKIFTIFAALALFIACLGLFSLSSFMAQKRRKEVGIRKVLGAQISDILGSFYKNYAMLVGISCLIAIPLSYLFLRNWLNQFAFRINMPIVLFVLAMITALCIAFATVSYESIKAATQNPVDSLKSE